MKESGGKLLKLCVFSLVAALSISVGLGTAFGQEPAGSPALSPPMSADFVPPGAGSSPVSTPSPSAAPDTSASSTAPTPAPAASQAPSPMTSATSATPAETGTAPATPATPAVTGTGAPGLSGTAPAESGTAAAAAPTPASPYDIEIDLNRQRAILLKNGTKIAEAPISSGRTGHLTPTGNFSVIQKDLNHFSNLYGKIVDKGSGRVVKSGADVATPVPKGCKFEPAPMKWFLRFEGASGMHAGILPGYPASHGCVRMPASKAKLFFETVQVGTPVHVFGTPPERSASSESEAPHHRTVAVVRTTPPPAATPKPHHGWWPF